MRRKGQAATYEEKVGSPKLHVGGASGTRVDPGTVTRLAALVHKMAADPYVMGRPTVASIARSALLLGLEQLELRYGVTVAPVQAEEAQAAE